MPSSLDAFFGFQTWTLILPELWVLGCLLLVMLGEIFLSDKAPASAKQWRFIGAYWCLALAMGLAYQRWAGGLEGSFGQGLFEVHWEAGWINLLILALGLLTLIMHQVHQEDFSFESLLGFWGILAGALFCSISAHWLSLLMSVETMSISMYVLLGSHKTKEGIRALVPLVLFGMGSTAFWVYGISLAYGLTGSLSLFDTSLGRELMQAPEALRLVCLALLSTGFLFKMAWAPFHPWKPDVMQQLRPAWMLWISTAPKIAIALVGLKWVQGIPLPMHLGLSILAILTLLIGHLGAIRQSITKRLMAYSSIAQGGFLALIWLMPYAVGLKNLWQYGLFYGIASALVFFQVEDKALLKDFAGQGKTQPLASVCLILGLITLVGLPPLALFWPKFQYFLALYEQYQVLQAPGILWVMWVSILGTALAMFYYLQIPFQLFFKPVLAANPTPLTWAKQALYLFLAGLLVLGFFWPQGFQVFP